MLVVDFISHSLSHDLSHNRLVQVLQMSGNGEE